MSFQFEDTIDTPIFSISDLLKPEDFSVARVITTKERKDAKKVELRNKSIELLKAEDMRILNRHRYNEFLKANKLLHSKENVNMWLKCKDVRFKKMEKIGIDLFCVWTAKFSEHQLHKVWSECRDLTNRKGSPNLYAWSLRKRRV